MKLLGFHFDTSPSPWAHVKSILKKVRYRTWAVHNLKRLGMSAGGLLSVYKSLILPCFDYSCVVYHSMLNRNMSEQLERLQRKILKIIFGWDISYSEALRKSGLERLDVRRSILRERFVVKLSENARFSDWIPLAETPVYPLRNTKKYVEKPFKTERLRGAPLYSFRRILNFLESENAE